MLAFCKKKFLGNALARHSLTLFSGFALVSVLNYFFHLLIGRFVDVEAYGEIESLNSMISIIGVPAATITMVATQYAAEFKADDDRKINLTLIKYLNKKLLIVILPIFLLFLLLIPWITRFLNFESPWPIFVVGVYLAVSLFLSINNGTLAGWKKFKEMRRMSVCNAITKLVLGVGLVKLGFSVLGAIMGYFIGVLFAYLLSFKLLGFIFQEKGALFDFKFDFKKLKQHLFILFWGNLALNVLGNVDMVLAKHNLDPSLAGQYGALTVVSKIIFFVTSIIATVTLSLSSESHHKKENSSKIFFQALFLTVGASTVAVLGYFLFPKLILGIFFGTKYVSVAHYLGWFGVLAGLFSVLNLMLQYSFSIRKTKIVYGLLLAAFFSTLLVLFTGHDICTILEIMIGSQVAVIIIGSYFLTKAKNGKREEIDLNYNPVV